MTPSRDAIVLALRDRAVSIIQTDGKPERVGDALFASAEHNSLRILLRTPFTKWSDERDSTSFDRAVLQHRAQVLPNGLDIWAGKKVLCIQWDDQQLEVISFRRGDWEQVLSATATRPSAALCPVGSEDEARGGHEAPAHGPGPTVPGTGPRRLRKIR